ncbi:CDP-alcohol phosphatidyltransferase family protein [Granulosicoccus antarcticus]|uniref:CDP-alcohol phosphatidyltransferase n=1 Tax=Granulosicoccus antarcticus IMCC3135 TaxID=1192854 RepID=A0A2Z2NIN2_9GAMM|nr:CDP-alcohol phosphatidyltransferase family protein [Granulosicoccus antarcticus]ASJ71196.1 hypothetical protein IMCC3135_05420 [Granulosicoccus antarcticus IMCC3135]
MRPEASLHKQAAWHFLIASLVFALSGIATLFQLNSLLVHLPSISIGLTWTILWSLILALNWRGLGWHPYSIFGKANAVTLYRAAGTVLIAGLVPVASELQMQWPWLITGLVVLLLSLDGVDGYLARRSGLASEFGARFDMETDALLILVVSVFVWYSGETGIWIISLGLMRYLFVLASLWSKALRGNLYPSFRRKLVCVIQLVVLCAILSPLLAPPLSDMAGLLALLCLAASFIRDVLWLYRHRSSDGRSAAHNAPGIVASNEITP